MCQTFVPISLGVIVVYRSLVDFQRRAESLKGFGGFERSSIDLDMYVLSVAINIVEVNERKTIRNAYTSCRKRLPSSM